MDKDDEEFDNLTDEQFAALDNDVANVSHIEEGNEKEEIFARREPSQLQSDFFADITNKQFAIIDGDIANKRQNSQQINRNRLNNQNGNSVDENYWMDDDDFGDIPEAQLEAIDREVESYNLSQNNGNDVNENAIVESTQSQNALNALTELEMEIDDNGNKPSKEHLYCLQSKFKHSIFRDKQWEIIHSIMNEKRDVIAVMATGYGKSLCFQFPAVYKNGIVLVICPLISLMKAQVYTLQKANIKACLVGTAQPDTMILTKIARGEFNIIYSSPEYLQGRNGYRMLNSLKNRLTLVAIDESHCVSQWGFDFRPAYRSLSIIRENFPNTPILALTATATPQVRHDIRTSLGLRNSREIVTSFDRPNLEFLVFEKSASIWQDLGSWVSNINNGSVIVYVLKQIETITISQIFQNYGVQCAPYHAKMDENVLDETLKRFLRDELKVVVATIAFGMGIDKPDIRTVINYGSPKNLEAYYQQVGRAGRDGLPSKAVTYFSLDDFTFHDFLLEQEHQSHLRKSELPILVKKSQRDLALHVREFMHSSKCRRKVILEYFGEDTSSWSRRANCCDNCAKGVSTWPMNRLYYEFIGDKYNFTSSARLLLGAINEMQQNGIPTDRKGVIQFLRGTSRRGHFISFFGKGATQPPYYWDAIIDQFMFIDYIEFVPDSANLKLSQDARNWLTFRTRHLLQKPVGATFRFFKLKPNTPISNNQWNQNYKEDDRHVQQYPFIIN